MNKISYDAQAIFPDPHDDTAILYETAVCPALSLVASTWQIGFYENTFIENPTPADFEALGCQMHAFVALLMEHYYNHANIDVMLQSLSWSFFPPAEGHSLNVTGRIKVFLWLKGRRLWFRL